MKKSNLFVVKVLAFFLTVVVLFTSFPAGVFSVFALVKKAPMQISVIADLHYYPQSLMGNKGAAWKEYCNDNSNQYIQTDALVDAALNAISLHSKKNVCKYLLIPGDLTKDSEYAGNSALAARLERFEKKSGIQVLVINGNHDVNNDNASTFKNGRKEPTRATTPEEFRSLYKNLGYDLAYRTYTPPAGEKAGMLSYSVRLAGGYRLLALDGGKYSSDSTADGENEHETGGNYSKGLMTWALAEMADAKRCGETVIGLTHHNLVNQFEAEQSMFQDFVIDKWVETAETFANAGMHYSFSGHMHGNNIASHVSDKGETLYDCETASLTGFPNSFREVRFDNTGNSVKATYKTLDVDCEQQIKAEGVAYKKPYKYTYSFGQSYGKTGFADFGERMAEGFVNGFFESITKQGGLYSMLENSDINLEGIVDNAIKGGLKVGDYEIFTTTNIMSFVKDLSNQIDEVFVANPEKVLDIVHSSALKLVSMPVSDYPCTKFIDTVGFGNAKKAGTLQDAAYSALNYMYEGNEDISDDVFMKDVIDFFENRDGADVFYTTLKDILVNDIVQRDLLSVLKFNPGTLFPDGSFGQLIGDLLNAIVELLFPKDSTYLNIITSALATLPLGYENVNDIVDKTAEEYLTQSQLDSVGHTIAQLIGGFVIDKDPGFKKDTNVTLTYSGHVPVVPTAEDYRLPSQVAVTFGDKTDSTRNINWFTKYSVTGTDIELVPYSKKPVFKGKATKGAGIESSREKVLRGFPGVDLGLTGLLDYEFALVRHSIKLTGLAAGQKYCYRVGDASKGWWSKTGVIETADNSNAFTFFHMTDPQAQNEKQYATWANVVSKAFDKYPNSKFILSSGDLTDSPSNVRQWKWLLDTTSTDLLSTVLMPTAGNHEKKDSSLELGFVLPASAEQDKSSGTYYSYDYNNAHFIVLNTNDLTAKNVLSEEQINWLKNDAAASDAQWKIVSLHKAIYSNGSHYDDKDVVAIRKQLRSLLPELDVDLVLQGHDHVYLRTDAMKGNRVVKSKTSTVSYKGLDYKAKLDPNGSVYVISGCAGVKNYLPKSNSATDKLFPRAESIVTAELPIFSAIQIDGNKLYFDAYTVDGKQTKRIDSFAIEKAAK